VEAHAIHAQPALRRRSAAGPLLRLRSDDQLVALFRMGYDDAFRVIHDRYRQRLFAYARQMLAGSRSDAEDALQDVFLRAYAALRHDDRPVTLRAWLYRVAHNRCVDELRRPLPPPPEVLALTRSTLHDALEEVERREDLRRLVEDVRRLPGQQRSALLMRELEGLTYAELADALDTTIPAVKSLLVRARMGLLEAGEARDAGCAEIRADLALTHDRGVRISGRARRHLRDCAPCRSYRAGLRLTRQGFGALGPGHGPLAAFAKLLGIGGAGSGAAASATAGGSAAVAGSTATVAATKVVAVVCCAAVVGGGAAKVEHRLAGGERARAAAPARVAVAPAAVAAARPALHAPARATRAASAPRVAARPERTPPRRHRPARAHPAAPSLPAKGGAAAQASPAPPATAATGATTAAPMDPDLAPSPTGGAAAPDEDALPDPPAPATAATVPAPPAQAPAPAAAAPATGQSAAADGAEAPADEDGPAADPGEAPPTS
jgi:RNA polymerase sigma factor (sigma-70 family)